MIKRIPLDLIVQTKPLPNEKKIREFMIILRREGEDSLGQLLVKYKDGKYYILDGTHRSLAKQRLGYETAVSEIK